MFQTVSKLGLQGSHNLFIHLGASQQENRGGGVRGHTFRGSTAKERGEAKREEGGGRSHKLILY